MSETSSGDPITLTPTAKEKAAEYLKQDKAREVFRVSFDDRGKLSVELDRSRHGDAIFMQGDIKVAVAEPIVGLLRGLTIDFGKNPEGKEGFQFTGPPLADSELGRKAKEALTVAPTAPAPAHAEGAHASEWDYLKIFFSLAILTVAELIAAQWLPIPKVAIIFALVILAFVKAALVGMYFMHLKFEGRWKHILLVPPVILAIVLIFALMPDVGRTGAWPHDPTPGHIISTEK